MRASEKGININRPELAALLEFSGDDSQFGFVHFRVNGNGKIIASATDGRRSVEFTSEADAKAATGEWRCDRQFIEACRRLIDPNETQVLLKVTAKGMREVLIIGIEDESERGRYKVPSDAVSTQLTMDKIHAEIGGDTNLDQAIKRSWFAMSAKTLKPLIAVERAAAGCPITIYAGKKPDSVVNFEARSIGGHWLGAFKPSAVTGPGDEAPDDEDTDDETPGQAAPRPLELVAPLATEKKKRAKASKRPAKKAPSKRAPRASEAPAEAG